MSAETFAERSRRQHAAAVKESFELAVERQLARLRANDERSDVQEEAERRYALENGSGEVPSVIAVKGVVGQWEIFTLSNDQSIQAAPAAKLWHDRNQQPQPAYWFDGLEKDSWRYKVLETVEVSS